MNLSSTESSWPYFCEITTGLSSSAYFCPNATTNEQKCTCSRRRNAGDQKKVVAMVEKMTETVDPEFNSLDLSGTRTDVSCQIA